VHDDLENVLCACASRAVYLDGSAHCAVHPLPRLAGLGNAYSLVVNDDNWKQDKFAIVSGGNNFTLDYLNAGDQYVHEFTVVPIKKTWHRVRPAKMAFIDGVEGEK
jgi:hypothetical protein